MAARLLSDPARSGVNASGRARQIAIEPDSLRGGRQRLLAPANSRKKSRCVVQEHGPCRRLIFTQTGERKCDRCREPCCRIWHIFERDADEPNRLRGALLDHFGELPFERLGSPSRNTRRIQIKQDTSQPIAELVFGSCKRNRQSGG